MVAIDAEKDYYAILGIPASADDNEIKHAYRELARRHHPDTGGDPERFRQIQEAYEILRESQVRAAYDRQVEARRTSPGAALSWQLTLSRSQMQSMEAAQVFYLMIDINPQGNLQTSRLPLNLALVIDRSTSMRGVRIENVKTAALDLIESLQPDDRLSVIAFSDRAEVLSPSTAGVDKRMLRSAISAVQPGGGTEIFQGVQAGLEQIRRYGNERFINHLILLTDGRTYGDEAQSLAAAEGARAGKIGISALGIGDDWNDLFLDDLARKGGGISQYISSPSQIQQLLRDQIRGLSAVVSRSLSLVINVANSVRVQAAYRATPYMERLEFGDGRHFPLGNLRADEPITLMIEFVVMQPEAGERRLAQLNLEAESLDKSEQRIHLRRDVVMTFRTQPPEPTPVPSRLLNLLSRLSIFRLQEKAWEAVEAGDTQQATHLLQAAATRLFDMGYKDLAQAAMLEVGRISGGESPTMGGRKKLRYGTRSLSMPSGTGEIDV